jgi:DNA-binding transcriptional LysR family regulator
MELVWIDDFLALHNTRNFTRAAEVRCTTQSAYSRRIQRLEEWLGAPLFYRESRPISLTPAGEEFLARALRLREDIFDARRATLSATSHFRKNLRLYTTNTLATAFVPRWLIENKYESYSLIVASTTGCLEAVKRGHADFALIPHFGEAKDLSGLSTHCLGQDSLKLVALPKVGAKVTLEKGKLSGPLMAYTPGTTYGAKIAQMLDSRRIKIQGAPLCESPSAEALLAQVEAGLGAAWIPQVLLDKSKARPCRAPAFFDIPYKIFRIAAQTA